MLNRLNKTLAEGSQGDQVSRVREAEAAQISRVFRYQSRVGDSYQIELTGFLLKMGVGKWKAGPQKEA